MFYVIDYTLPVGNRRIMRQNLIQTFLYEEPGTGAGDCASHYQYNVEHWGNYSIDGIGIISTRQFRERKCLK